MASRVKSSRMGILLPALVLFLVALLSFRFFNEAPANPSPDTFGKAPTFSLTATDGSTLSSESLAGKVWLMNFFFASCPGPCPLINSDLRRLKANPAVKDHLRILSVTVDPNRDTPERLAEYGARYGAKPGDWDFLTGTPESIRTLIEGGFKLISPEDVSMHTTRIVLVDRTGEIRGFFQGTDSDAIKQMFQDVATVVAESSPVVASIN